jgi:hypothetical protein
MYIALKPTLKKPMTVGNMEVNGFTPTNNDLDLYQSDNRKNRKEIEDQLGIQNPAAISMANVGSNIDDSGHAYKFLNPFKTCEIAIQRPVGATEYKALHTPTLNDPSWGNWRLLKKGTSSVRFVPEQVFLTMDDYKFSFDFTHELTSPYEGLTKFFEGTGKYVTDAIDVIASMAAGFKGEGDETKVQAGGKFMSGFQGGNLQWKKTLPMAFSTNPTFKFHFGDAGLFSGEYEVVRPIIALVSQFSLIRAGENSHYYLGPGPTASTFAMNLVKGGADFLSKIPDIKNSVDLGSFGGFANTLSAAEEAVYEAIDNAISGSINDPNVGLSTLSIRFGRLVSPPLVCKGVSWTFDMTEIDEYGFPTAGSVSLKNLEAIGLPTDDQITSIALTPSG